MAFRRGVSRAAAPARRDARAPGAAPVGIAHTGNSIFNVPASALRCPAVSLPLMRLGGLPLGIQLLGQPHAERALSGVAADVAGLDVVEG